MFPERQLSRTNINDCIRRKAKKYNKKESGTLRRIISNNQQEQLKTRWIILRKIIMEGWNPTEKAMKRY